MSPLPTPAPRRSCCCCCCCSQAPAFPCFPYVPHAPDTLPFALHRVIPPQELPFGQQLVKALRAVSLDEMRTADTVDIAIARDPDVDLPGPDDELPEGGAGPEGEDPREAASWQLAAIEELARRHGFELVPTEDAEEMGAEGGEAEQEEGVVEEEDEEAAEQEQLLLESMCDNEDEVMQLRTGMLTPVQLYLRFKVRVGWCVQGKGRKSWSARCPARTCSFRAPGSCTAAHT